MAPTRACQFPRLNGSSRPCWRNIPGLKDPGGVRGQRPHILLTCLTATEKRNWTTDGRTASDVNKLTLCSSLPTTTTTTTPPSYWVAHRIVLLKIKLFPHLCMSKEPCFLFLTNINIYIKIYIYGYIYMNEGRSRYCGWMDEFHCSFILILLVPPIETICRLGKGGGGIDRLYYIIKGQWSQFNSVCVCVCVCGWVTGSQLGGFGVRLSTLVSLGKCCCTVSGASGLQTSSSFCSLLSVILLPLLNS